MPTIPLKKPATQELASTTKQKGGKKIAKTPTEAAPEVAAAPALVAEATSAKPISVKKGGKPKKVEAPALTPIVEATPKTNKVKKVAKAGTPSVTTDEQEGGKPKTAKKQVIKKAKTPVVETTEQTETTEPTERLVRSFKVKLPLKEEFEGRFTGLTPYQAANKALSKYFRETENPKQEITFLICESTRKSKKSVYTYIGKRYQLEVPVKYTIQDGREIVKNFKNSLKKVKKVDLANEQAAGAAVVTTA